MSRFKPEAYAVDFGTTNSLLAAANPTAIVRALPLDPLAFDPTVFRSILYFDPEGHTSYGAEALRRYEQEGMQGRLVRSLKRHLPSRSFVGTEVAGRHYRLEDLIGGILRKIRERANAHFETDVDRVVLGRPARFSEVEADDSFAEERLKAAAVLAGFSEISLCPEPLAAAHDFQRYLDRPKTVLICDLGGGTSDFSLIRMDHRGYRASDVLATGGVSVAGDALDGALMQHHIAVHFGAQARYRAPFGKNELTMPLSLVHRLYSSVDMSLLSRRDVLEFLRRVENFSVSDADAEAVQRLLVVAEDALGFQVYEAIESLKQTLAGDEACETPPSFRFDYPDAEVCQPVTREQFEGSVAQPLARIFAALDSTLRDAGMVAERVQVVCCTGGTAKVGLIARRLRELFPNAEHHTLSSFRAVADGLALRAQLELQ